MFETTIEKDLQSATTDAERKSIFSEIQNKYRNEFLAFIEELKKSGIVQALYNSSTPEETISIWDKYSSENQEFFARIKSWAEGRVEYFDCCEPFPLFKEDEEIEYLLEIGLIILIIKDEFIFLEEDINQGFNEKLIELLKKSSNQLLKAAGWFIECDGYESMTKENIYNFYPDFYPED